MMIKTLRITSIVAASLALVFLVSSVVFGVRGNSEIEEFLGKPGAVEVFTKARIGSSGSTTDKTSPLVKQAQSFARFLNPPVDTKITKIDPRDLLPSTPTPPVAPKPKFRLIGISYCEGKPEESLAFVDEVGKGSHWVRLNAMLGHLKVEEINEDSIVVASGGERTTLTYESAPASAAGVGVSGSVADRIAALRAGGGQSPAASIANMMRSGSARTIGKSTTSSRPTTVASKPRTRPTPTAPTVDPAEQARLEALVSQLRGMQKSINTEKSGSIPVSPAEKAAQIDKLMSGARPATHVTPDEAKRLGDLGKRLNGRDANSAGSRAPSRIPPRPPLTRTPSSSSGR